MFFVQTIFTVFMSVAIGLLMGIIGGGGGGIYVVVLLILLHQNAKTAAMTALALSTLTLSGASWQYWKKQQFRTDYFVVLSILDIAGTLLGNVLLNRIPENVLRIVIFAVLIFSGLTSLLKVRSSKRDDSQVAPAVEKLTLVAPVGLASGLATGTTGLSASTMISSYLIGLLDFSPYLAVGTTTLVSFVGNVVSIALLLLGNLFLHTSALSLDLRTLLTLGIGSALGALWGAKLTTKIDRKVLTVVLAAMAILPGIYLAIKK